MKNNFEWKILIFITLVIVVMDFTGILDHIPKSEWFLNHSNSIIIASIISLLFFIIKIFEKNEDIDKTIENKIDKLENRVSKTIMNSLQAPFIKTFESEQEFKNYYISKVANAKRSVDDLTWSHKISANSQLKPTKDLEKILEKNIDKTSSKLIYREIFIFSSPSRITKLINRLVENKEGYLCSYYELNIELPRLQFLIIDKQEVIFTSSNFGEKFAVINPIIIKMLLDYFEVSWGKSKCLKRGHEWNMNNLKQVLGEEKINQILKKANSVKDIKEIESSSTCQ